MTSPCPFLSPGSSLCQWMPALEKSPKKIHLQGWMPRWSSSWRLEYQTGRNDCSLVFGVLHNEELIADLYVCLQVNSSHGNTRSAWRFKEFIPSPRLLWFGQSSWPAQQRWMTHEAHAFFFFSIYVLNIFLQKKKPLTIREFRAVGVPWWFSNPAMGFAPNRGGWGCPGAAGALHPPKFGGLRLFAPHSSRTQRPGASQESHRTPIANVNRTTCLIKTVLHTNTKASWWMWTAEPLFINSEKGDCHFHMERKCVFMSGVSIFVNLFVLP